MENIEKRKKSYLHTVCEERKVPELAFGNVNVRGLP